MNTTIELPDPLFAEIHGYATRVATSPLEVVRLAWEEFRLRHAQETASPPVPNPGK